MKGIPRVFLLLLLCAAILPLIILPASAASVYVARGDPLEILQTKPQGTCWYFPLTGSGDLYDLPSTVKSDGTYCVLDGKATQELSPKPYTLIYEEPTPANGKYFKDASWVNNNLVSAFSAVHSIDESGKDGAIVMRDLKNIINKNGFNTFTETTFEIQEPDLKIKEMGQIADNLYSVSGTSNFADGTEITIKIDEPRYFAQRDESFTYRSKVVRQSNQKDGTWTANMLMPIQEMPPGWHTITVYSGDLVTESQFKVYEHEWGPAPTPTQYVKYLSDGNIAPVVVTVVQEKIIDHYIDRWHTATPTPAITDALGQDIEYPYKPGGQIPTTVAIVALLCIAGLVLVRDWKWKR